MSQRRSLNQSQVSLPVTLTAAVNECVRFILYREGSKIPIKRADIAKHLFTACDIQKNEVDNVISGAGKLLKDSKLEHVSLMLSKSIIAAKEVLKNLLFREDPDTCNLQVYGYCLVKDGAQYMVVLNEPSDDELPCPLVDPTEYALLNATLAHILMSGGSVREDDLWKFLTSAGLMKANDDAVTKIISKKFTSELYLTCTKKSATNTFTTFEWGQRAHKEASKMFILQKVAEALGKEPEYWFEQYKEASNEANSVTIGD